MATTNQFIGRQEGIGLGIEAVPGTPVAPQIWLRWLENSLQQRTTVAENESAMGVVDRTNDSEVTQKWMEGTIGGKLTSEAVGFLLLGYFGSVSTGTPTSGIYPHTFATNQSAIPTTMTVASASPLQDQRFPYGVFDNLEITAEAGGWVQISTAVKAQAGADSNDTPAFTAEREFTSKHVILKVADDSGSLAASSPVQASRVRVTFERGSEAFFPLGTDDKPQFDRGTQDVRGEFVVRLKDTEYEEDFLSNAVKALSVTMTNETHSLALSMTKVRYRELEKTKDRDNIVTATVQFFAEFDTAANAAVTAVLKNGRSSYVAA